MTLVEQAARAASAAFGVGASLSASAARTRVRASVMRAGALPVAMRPNLGGGGSAISPARIAMRSSMPRGANVQRAVQSMKSRSAVRSGGQSRTSAMGFRLSPPAERAATRRRSHAGAERHAHEGAGFELEVRGRAVAISGVDRDRREHVDDDARRGSIDGVAGRRHGVDLARALRTPTRDIGKPKF